MNLLLFYLRAPAAGDLRPPVAAESAADNLGDAAAAPGVSGFDAVEFDCLSAGEEGLDTGVDGLPAGETGLDLAPVATAPGVRGLPAGAEALGVLGLDVSGVLGLAGGADARDGPGGGRELPVGGLPLPLAPAAAAALAFASAATRSAASVCKRSCSAAIMASSASANR